MDSLNIKMQVVKRNGELEEVSFDKIKQRIKHKCNGLNIDPILVSQKVIARIYNNVKTSEIDELTAQICTSMATENLEYSILASRIIISNNHKNTSPSFSEVIYILYNNTDVHNEKASLISDEVYKVVMKNKKKLNNVINYERDYNFDYFAFKTLEKAYLMKVCGQIVERIQHLFMRVSIGLHLTDLKAAIESYNYMSQKYFIHATPTLFHSGTPRPQLLSCFLLGTEDSISGMYKNISDCAMISKWAGGIGVHISNIRSKNSRIRSTNGKSSGIIPMLKVYNECAKHVNQCFTPNTKIYTQKGVKNICNIKKNDYVITKDGSYKKVLNIFKNNIKKKILEIKIKNSNPVQVTKEHYIFINRNKKELLVKADEITLTDKTIKLKYTGKYYLPKLNDIEYIKEIDYKGDVYDLNIEDNHNYLTDIGLVHNSGKRNGSIAIYLEPHHPDIFEFLQLRKNHGNEEERCRDLFLALWISDLFMKRVEKDEDWSLFDPDECPHLTELYGEEFEEKYMNYEREGRARKTVKARTIWKNILDSQIETGTPYILFKDNINRKTNQKNLGTIKSSNLCVAGETKILTDTGYHMISDLENKNINVWNGNEFSNTIIKKTGEKQELLKITFSNKLELICTPYHKFYIVDPKNIYGKKHIVVEAQNLEKDMRLIKCEYPVIKDGKNEFKYPYVHGLFCADGTYSKSNDKIKYVNIYKFRALKTSNYCKRHFYWQRDDDDCNSEHCLAMVGIKKPLLYLYDEKIKLQDYINIRKGTSSYMNTNHLVIPLPLDINDKYIVPINYNINIKLRWLEGFVDGDGCVVRNGKTYGIQISSINKNFLTNILYLLQTLGVNSKINVMRFKSSKKLPDGRGGYKFYQCKTCYRLCISAYYLNHLQKLGFSPKRLVLNDHKPNRNALSFIKVENVEKIDRKDDTYCFTEPKLGRGIFNGIITGQCAEITEYSSSEEYACCTLSSIALSSYVKNKEFNGEFKIYGKSTCGYCKLAKMLLVNYKTQYIDLDNDEKRFKFYDDHNIESRTVPQVYYEEEGEIKHIGGYQDLVNYVRPEYDFSMLQKVVKIAVRNLNKIIDLNFYPVPETKLSNTRHRPLGLGVQGLADTYAKMRYPFDSPEAMELNKLIFETIYYAALDESCNQAKKYGTYSTYEGSPISQGELQFDMWGIEPSKKYNWNKLRKKIKKNGIRNSLLTALMPTASTSQILGNNECFEPFTSNIYSRRTIAGDFIVINKYLIKDLTNLGIWSNELKNKIIANNGSVQNIEEILQDIKDLYKTVWEIKQKKLIQQSIDRGPYICQTQSLNLFFEEPSHGQLTGALFFGWKGGLKTGSYYIRTRPKVQAQQFTIEPEKYKVCESCSG